MMDIEMEAPVDDLESIDAIEGEEEIRYAALRISSNDPLAC